MVEIDRRYNFTDEELSMFSRVLGLDHQDIVRETKYIFDYASIIKLEGDNLQHSAINNEKEEEAEHLRIIVKELDFMQAHISKLKGYLSI